MNEKEFFIDDRVIIPDDLKRMSKEELECEIARLEKELFESKKEIKQQHI